MSNVRKPTPKDRNGHARTSGVVGGCMDCVSFGEHDGGLGKMGYDVISDREFFMHKRKRKLDVNDAELASGDQRIQALLRDVAT